MPASLFLFFLFINEIKAKDLYYIEKMTFKTKKGGKKW